MVWKDEPFSHRSDFYQFPVPGIKETNKRLNGDSRYYSRDGEYIAMPVHPKPLHKPYPPLFMLGECLTRRVEIFNGFHLGTRGRLHDADSIHVALPTPEDRSVH